MGSFPVLAGSRANNPVNSRDGEILQEKFPRSKLVLVEGPENYTAYIGLHVVDFLFPFDNICR